MSLNTLPGTVWFVGAGPGDPELLTVKGRDLIARAGAILFAGSLVNEAATRWAPAGCTIADSKDMTLERHRRLADRAGRAARDRDPPADRRPGAVRHA